MPPTRISAAQLLQKNPTHKSSATILRHRHQTQERYTSPTKTVKRQNSVNARVTQSLPIPVLLHRWLHIAVRYGLVMCLGHGGLRERREPLRRRSSSAKTAQTCSACQQQRGTRSMCARVLQRACSLARHFYCCCATPRERAVPVEMSCLRCNTARAVGAELLSCRVFVVTPTYRPALREQIYARCARFSATTCF